MQRFLRMTVIAAGVLCVFGDYAQAQLFGARNFGSSLQPQSSAGGGTFGGPTPAPGLAPIPGGGGGGSAGQGGVSGSLATGNARFQRQNRSTADFVGKSGVNDPAALLNRGPAAAEVVERRVPEFLLNPPRTPASRTRMYEPRLSVGFPLASRPRRPRSTQIWNNR